MAAAGIPKPAAASSSAPASLEGAPIPLLELRRQGRAELLEILEAARGRKALVLDTALRGLLGYVVPEGTKFLRQHGVVHLCRGLHADLTFPPQEEEPEHVLYLVRPTISNMRLVAAQIRRRNGRRSAPARNYQLYLVPHRTFICERVLEDEGVRGQFSLVGECRLDLFPFDTDLLSLELEGSFKDCYVEEDTTMLTTVARSLQKLEDTFGVIPNVKAKGPYAAMALHRFLTLKKERLFRQRQQQQSSSPDTDDASSDPSSFGGGNSKTAPEIDTVVILDRAVDLVTPLLTPLTYEGVVDELIGVQHGAIKVEPGLVGDDQKDGPGGGGGGKGGTGAGSKDPVTVALNSDDPLYAEIRGLHLEALGQTLNEKAMEMRQTYARVKSETRDGSLNDIHDVVRSIPALQQKYRGLNLHINIAEYLKPATSNLKFQQRWQLERSMVEGETRYDELEDMVAAYEPVVQVLRLLCLQSLTGGGIKAGKYDALKREVIQAYGYEYLFTLANLETAGLLYRRPELAIGFGSSSSSAAVSSGGGVAGAAGPVGVTGNWAGVRKALRLVKESVRTLNPDDIAYVSSGYAPLSVRLLQLAHKPGWGSGNCADVLKQLPGPTVEFTQQPSLPTHGSGGSGSNCGASFLPVLAELDRLLAPPPPLMATAAASSSSNAKAGAAAKSTTTSSSSSGGGGIRTASPLSSGLFSIGSASSSFSAAAISGSKQQSQTSQQSPQPAIRGKTLPDGRKVMLAYFVGGVSFMEIAAMRHLSRQPDFPYRIVVCTTKLVNGNTLVQSVQEDIKNGLVAGTVAAPAGSGAGSSYWTPR